MKTNLCHPDRVKGILHLLENQGSCSGLVCDECPFQHPDQVNPMLTCKEVIEYPPEILVLGTNDPPKKEYRYQSALTYAIYIGLIF